MTHSFESLQESPEDVWNPDELQLVSVGIDIGSSTSHFLLSKLVMRRLGKSLVSRWVVTRREVIYRSPVVMTPYRADFSIDAGFLHSFFNQHMAESGVKRDQIDTGVVVLTGEALRRRNARALADLFADETGRFVCASAGHGLEARMAASGSGAVAVSREQQRRVLNIDVGGGTTKFALIDCGDIIDVAAINVGGRLIAYESNREIARIEPAARKVAKALGINLQLGRELALSDEHLIADSLAGCLVEIATARNPPSPLTSALMLTDPLHDLSAGDLPIVVMSGGVSEYLMDPLAQSFGDLAGSLASSLGRAIADGALPHEVLPARERIRATVIGLSQFTAQVSGDTIFVSPGQALPLRNVPVARVDLTLDETLTPTSVSALVEAAVKQRGIPADEHLLLALTWSGAPSYQNLHTLATGTAKAMERSIRKRIPLVVVIDQDVGRALGRLLYEAVDARTEVICVDGLDLSDLDFIDIGEQLATRSVVPVIVKSLLFPDDDGRGTEILQTLS